MIFVSSASIREKNLDKKLFYFKENNITDIELTGGTNFNNNTLNILKKFKEKYNFNFQLHNYFPIPKKSFVLNLASLDNQIFNQTLSFYKNSINFSKKIGAKRFSIHAGFFTDITANKLGKNFKIQKKLYNKEKCYKQFAKGFKELKLYAGKKIDLYIENHVLTKNDLKVSGFKNPLMLTCKKDYLILKKYINFKLLLDLAHLKVSSKTLNLNFTKEVLYLSQYTDYFHLSDNDGLSDNNKPLINKRSNLCKILKFINNFNYIYTLEVYTGIKDILESIKFLNSLNCHD
jgi:sugar phosphate isomerase/epimerase